MLVLGRRVGEKVVVGEGDKQIVITVKDLRGGRVTLSFEGSRDVNIRREELKPIINHES